MMHGKERCFISERGVRLIDYHLLFKKSEQQTKMTSREIVCFSDRAALTFPAKSIYDSPLSDPRISTRKFETCLRFWELNDRRGRGKGEEEEKELKGTQK